MCLFLQSFCPACGKKLAPIGIQSMASIVLRCWVGFLFFLTKKQNTGTIIQQFLWNAKLLDCCASVLSGLLCQCLVFCLPVNPKEAKTTKKKLSTVKSSSPSGQSSTFCSRGHSPAELGILKVTQIQENPRAHSFKVAAKESRPC